MVSDIIEQVIYTPDKKENAVKLEELDYKEVLSFLKTSLEDGITEEETKKRVSEYGYNEILEKKQSAILSIAKKFWGITPWMLEIVIIFSLFIHNYIDAYIIAGLLIVNAIIGFTQEERATKAVEILRRKLQVNARVLRDKRWKVVTARELVPGDIVRVRAGDFVPADLKIASNNVLKVDQSALTGESMPVDKKINDVLFSGSIIKRNEATAIVIKTGSKTYFGKTTDLIKFAKPKLHMEEITTKIVDRLLIIVITLIGAMFVVTYIRGLSLITVIPLALVLIVFAVPVALPAMFTVSMAFGSLEVSKKGVLLTRLSAIEDAASMDIVCADKTGTLTSNKLSISKTVELNGFSENDIILYGALASQEANQDPIDLAFISEANARNLPISDFKVKKFTPFDPNIRRTEAELDKGGKTYRIVKGAVSVIGTLCGVVIDKEISEKMDNFATKGYRTLAVAISENNGPLSLCGLVALYDMPRPDTGSFIQELKELGVSVKMLTGDAAPIAKEIAMEIGLGDKIVSSSKIKDLKSENPIEAANTAEKSDVFAEVYPEDKYIIVKSLQAKEHIIGMTGDGINDAPALKQAEVGIAVSTATDVAKGAASVVLTSEGLSNIVDLVKNGRKIYQRIVTWVLNKTVKTFQIAVFVALAFLITGYYVISALDVVLFLFLIDFVTISLSTDNTRGSKKPEKWNVTSLFKYSILLGIAQTIEMFGLLYIAIVYLKLSSDIGVMNTFFFASIMYFGLLTPLILRERGPFWSSRPGKTLLMSIIADMILVALISLLGFGIISTLPLEYFAIIIVYTFIVGLFLNDAIKIMFKKVGVAR